MASEINLVVGSQDVLTAFDQVDHEKEAKLLEERGVDLGTLCALLKENVGTMVQLRVPEVGLTKPVPMQKGKRAGKGRRIKEVQDDAGYGYLEGSKAMV